MLHDLLPEMYLRNNHQVSFIRVEGLLVSYIVDIFEFLDREF